MTESTPDLPPFPPARPRPVLILGALIAGLNAFVGAGALLDFLPRQVVGIVALVSVVVGAAGTVLVQGVVTPLSAPQDSRGRDLVPESTANASVRSAARAGAREGAAAATLQE